MSKLTQVPHRSAELRVHTEGGGTVIVPYAGTYLRRLRGLLWGGDELLLQPCNSVHGFGMGKTLEVAYINSHGDVLEIVDLKPWRSHRPRRGARAAWEAPPGRFAELGVAVGMRLRFDPA